jgi:hypothetical protein
MIGDENSDDSVNANVNPKPSKTDHLVDPQNSY